MYKILQGDVLERLAELPDESVQCVVTSPPYWGLRDYKLPPTVWGGRRECGHEWNSIDHYGGGGQPGEKKRWQHTGRGPSGHPKVETSFCPLCGAWRGSLGLEPDPTLYVEHIVSVFREVRRVLRKDGTLWLNLGDSYAAQGGGKEPGLYHSNTGQAQNNSCGQIPRRPPLGLKPKDLCMIPARVALALQADGWWLRSEIIWHKPNCMPSSVRDRPTVSHEQVFLLTKSAKYYFDQEAVKEPLTTDPKENYPARARITGRGTQGAADARGNDRDKSGGFPPLNGGRNIRSVWTIPTQSFPDAHFAVYPEALVEPCIKAGTSEKGCCPKCSAPWMREVERDFKPQHDVSKEKGIRGHQGQKPMDGSNTWQGFPRGITEATTIGWNPSCGCGAEPVPCTVLDPFGGAGTTAVVALRLARNAILIELSPEYCEMAERRIRDQAPLFHNYFRGGSDDRSDGRNAT